jgi:putative sugar O-methyltransferase
MIQEASMQIIQYLYRGIDLIFRVRNFARRRIKRRALFSQDGIHSDSQVTFYEQSVSAIISSNREFKRFRRIYDYREILEHVDYNLGKKYLDTILTRNPRSINDITNFKNNDLVGRPRTYYFKGVGQISPTTLRYIAVAMDLQEKFGRLNFPRIVEIGAGYGGQAAILQTLQTYEQYFIYDLPDVQKLIRQYSSLIKTTNLEYPDINNSKPQYFDLVISNYAFSELPRDIQNQYLEKVILKSNNGYMLMNSGKENRTGRSDGKITLQELREMIPNLEEYPELPLTSPDNYLLVWRK